MPRLLHSSDEGSISLWGAVSIGVGGMVGGGILAVLGLSVQITPWLRWEICLPSWRTRSGISPLRAC